MDEKFLEQAAAIELMQRESGIAAARSKPETDPAFDGVHCIERSCGEEIPPARLALGKIRCVPCQTLRETGHAYTH